MHMTRYLVPTLLLASLAASPSFGQTKAQIAKTAQDFQLQSLALSSNLAGLTKRVATASPNDREMLKLVNGQLAIVDALAGNVMVLGALAGEMKDASDLSVAKRHLASSCKSLKASADSTGGYIGSVAASIALPATIAEVGKAKDLLLQLGQHPLCNLK